MLLGIQDGPSRDDMIYWLTEPVPGGDLLNMVEILKLAWAMHSARGSVWC